MRRNPQDQRTIWAAFVTAARERAGLTKIELAKRMQVSRNTIGRWESGRYQPDRPDDAVRLAAATGVDPDEALLAAGFRPTVRTAPKLPQPPLDPDLAWLAARLQDPTTSEAERDLIRATVRHLARLADADDQRRAG